MVKSGADLAAMVVRKTEYSHLLLMWDHRGSGREDRAPADSEQRVRDRLVQMTWQNRSDAIVIVPELEAWLWQNPSAIKKYLQITERDLRMVGVRCAAKYGCDERNLCTEYPKEFFELAMYQQQRRKPLPRDFELIARGAQLAEWHQNTSFAALVNILRRWFG
jgi:hypothetical protein